MSRRSLNSYVSINLGGGVLPTNLVTTNSPNEQQALLYEYLNTLTLDGNTITQILFSKNMASSSCHLTINGANYVLYSDGIIENTGGYGGQ